MSAENVSNAAQLPLLYDKRLAQPTNVHLTAYCDNHDLIATVNSTSGDIVIYRINGQTAFTIKGRPDEAEVAAMKWKPDGSLLAVCWTDGMCGVYSGEHGKLLSQTSALPKRGAEDWKLDLSPDFGVDGDDEELGEEERVVVAIGWTSYGPVPKVDEDDLGYGELTETADEVFATLESNEAGTQSGGKTASKTVLKELAASITTQDVTKVLPQLSAIPSHGARHGPDGSKFASQTGVDDVFDIHKRQSETVDSLITATKSGHTNILLDESVQIGNFEQGAKPLLHTSHPECSSEAILSDSSEDGTLSLNYIDLPLDTLGSPLLHVIATNTKRIQHLMAYISQTIRCIQHDFNTGLQFPTRLMNNISEELSEKEEGSLVMNLYQLAMTGTFTPTMLEWLTDIVKEPNHKRWDLSVSTMYSSIRDHLFINLLPALDRLSIAASTLRGHAMLHEGTSKFDVPSELFGGIIEQADSLRLVAQKMLQVIMTEFRQFRAFSKWIKIIIEIGVAGPGTKGAIEAEEREVPNLDYGLLLEYIQQTLSESNLSLHLEPRSDMRGTCEMSEFFKHPSISEMRREHTINAIEQLSLPPTGGKFIMKDIESPEALVNLPALAVCLAGQVRLTIESITKWQSKMLPKPSTTQLTGPSKIDKETQMLDMRMFPRHNNQPDETIVCILASAGGTELFLYREVRLQGSKKSDFLEMPVADDAGKILTARLTTEKQCTVLFEHSDGRQSLLSCDFGATYEHRDEECSKVLHSFASNASFKANHFVIGGRKGKMVCVLFGRSGKEWRVFNLEDGSHSIAGGSSSERMQF